MHSRFAVGLLAALTLAVSLAPAAAHRLKVFASVVGASVEGRAYFVGGGVARNAPVTLRDGGGKIVAEERTDSNGRFALLAPIRTDLTVIVDAKDGHVARFDIPAAHLPDTLPAGDDEETATTPTAEAGNRKPADAYAAASADEIDAVVARQIAPLAERFDSLESSLRLRDVLGGLGYIVGIFGLIAFLKARHRAPDKSAP